MQEITNKNLRWEAQNKMKWLFWDFARCNFNDDNKLSRREFFHLLKFENKFRNLFDKVHTSLLCDKVLSERTNLKFRNFLTRWSWNFLGHLVAETQTSLSRFQTFKIVTYS